MTAQEDRPGPECPRFFYLDTCIISHLVRGEIHDFVPFFKAKGHELVVSDLTLSELSRGSSQDEMRFLERHGFQKIIANAPLWIDGKISFSRIENLQETNTQPHPIEGFLQEFLRFTSGSASVVDVGESFKKSVLDTLEDLKLNFSADSDLRLRALLHSNIDAAQEAIVQAPTLPPVRDLKATLSSQKIGPKFFADIAPPNIIEKIEQRIAKEHRAVFKNAFRPILPSDDIRARVKEACLNLVLLGFARDKNIAKDDEAKSRAGAISQFNDIGHIACAVGMELFITADSRLAKLAWAAYEPFGISTAVCHASVKSEGQVFRLVGENYWPRRNNN
jgi:hypothetical protein